MKNNRAFLSIVGPTATGKTALALWAAHQIPSGAVIISADSRQVFKKMSIATGADLPSDFTQDGEVWRSADGKVIFHGIATIEPVTTWSAYDFIQLAYRVITQAWVEGKLPILVGGTGLYHQLIWRPAHFRAEDRQALPAAQARPEVREKAEVLSLEELQNWAKQANAERFAQLNQSDRANPRRLVRVIEKALFEQEQSAGPVPELPKLEKPISELTIGLTASTEFLQTTIAERVGQRIKAGAIQETEQLMANYSDQDWKSPSFSATGYRELRQYVDGLIDLPTAQAQWTQREVRYAKRQLTWWKKYGAAEWFDVSQPEGLSQAKQKISAWINTFTLEQK